MEIFLIIQALSNVKRGIFFPWSVLDYSLRSKPKFKCNFCFLKKLVIIQYFILNTSY